MSYGFKFLNNSNETIIDDTSVKPWFYGQAPSFMTYDVTAYYNRLNSQSVDEGGGTTFFTEFAPSDTPGVTHWYVYSIQYYTPSSYDCFICITLPNNNSGIYYACEKPYSLIGENTISVLAFVPNTWVPTASDIPKAYIFVTNPVPNANLSTGYGMQVFTANQQCTFDSAKKHFEPYSLPSIYITDPNSYVYTETGVLPINVSTISIPSNPAFLLPGVDVVYAGGDWENGTYATYNKAIYKRKNSDLYIAVPKTRTVALSNTYTTAGFFNTGSLGVQPIVVVDSTPLDQGYTAPEFPASYALTINQGGMEEGLFGNIIGGGVASNTVIITLNTAGVPNGTTVPYTISGTNITASDFTSNTLTGNFVVNYNQASVTLQAAVDSLLEGTETATLALNNGKASISFTISDMQSYSLSSSLGSPEEAQSILVTLTTTNVPNGTVVPFTVTGISQADLTEGSLSGSFTVSASGANGTAQYKFAFARDTVWESESLVLTLGNNKAYISIPITDLSYGYSPTLTISPSTFRTNQTTVISIYGGPPSTNFEFYIAPTGTQVIDTWNNRWLPSVAPLVSTQYFDENGSFYNTTSIGNDFGGVGNWTLWVYTFPDRQFISANVTVTAVPTFTVKDSFGNSGPITVNEGTTRTFNITTTNVPNGTVIYPKVVTPWTITNDNSTDIVISGINGVSVNNNSASFNITFVADNLTESDPDLNPSGQEYFTLVVDSPNGTRVATFGQVNINDTSLTPATYSVTRSAATVNEGSYVDFTFTTNQVGTLYWTLTGMEFDDIWYVESIYQDPDLGPQATYLGKINSGTISNYGQIRIWFAADQITEGSQNATFDVHTGNITGPIVATATVTINDTSKYPAAGTTNGGPYCVGYDKYQKYNDGSGGTYSTLIETNSAFCGFNVYDEQVVIASDDYGDYIVQSQNYFTITIGPSEPNTYFDYSITNNGDPQPTSWPASAQIGPGGYFTNYIRGQDVFGVAGATGDKRLWVKFRYNQHIRSGRINVVANAGTLNGGQYCSGYNLLQNYNNGRGGIYTQTVQSNSPTCGYVQQYYPSMSQTYYYYYNQDFVRDIWYITGAKPNSAVKFTIVAGPNYVGASTTITTDGNGNGTYDIGAAAYTAGLYTINATFPNDNANYPTSYRTLVFYWYVIAGSGGGGGGY